MTGPQGDLKAAELCVATNTYFKSRRAIVCLLEKGLESFDVVRRKKSSGTRSQPRDTEPQVFVLKRPGVDEFLERVAKLYEVIIFTASLPQYANPLLDLVRQRSKIPWKDTHW